MKKYLKISTYFLWFPFWWTHKRSSVL